MESHNKVISSVRNPLSIIALFVLLIEVIASLSSLNNHLTFGQRYCFVIFCTVFPVLVLIVFFLIAWYRPNHFYSPQDFADENNYVKLLKKKIDDMNEIIQQGMPLQSVSNLNMNLSDLIDFSEKRAIEELRKEFGTSIITEVRSKDGKYIYDGIIRNGNRNIYIEVKYFQSAILTQTSLYSINRFSKSVNDGEKILAIVTPKQLNEEEKYNLIRRIKEIDVQIELRFYALLKN